MDDSLDELKTACRAVPVRSNAERIDEGESSWFAGRAAPADDGFVAIAQDDDITTIIRERDVVEVKKQKDFFLVRVRADADVLVRFERVTKARPQECGCEDAMTDEGDAPASIARSAAFGDDAFGPFGTPFGRCRLFRGCMYLGGTKICWWVVFCPSKVGRI